MKPPEVLKMSGVGGVSSGSSRHFREDEEAALRADASSAGIIKKDTGAALHGFDRTRPQVKEHQQSVSENGASAGVEAGHALAEGSDIVGVSGHAVEAVAGANAAAAVEAGATILGPIAGLALGVHSLMEAHQKGDEQAAAIQRDTAHVALIGVLDLPSGYKTSQFEGKYAHVGRGVHDPASSMTASLQNDPKGLAVLQLHCDRGMNAARDAIAAAKNGVTMQAFLAQNPRVADALAKDPAFAEGFSAYLSTASDPAGKAELDRKLNERDGWYAQSSVQFRV